MIAKTPKPPYYAVIFSSLRTDIDEGYAEMNELIDSIAPHQDGFLGIESVRQELGITVSFWRDLESIKKWREQQDHKAAAKQGREMWYKSYKVRICKVERDYAVGDI